MRNRFVVFTGAGCSAESGIPTFRDTGGLWEQYSVDEVCNIHQLHRNLDNVHTFYSMIKETYAHAKPNAAHYALAELQAEHGVDNFQIFTSNVDMLLEAAGCKDVVHVHGDMDHMNCTYCFGRKYIGDAPFIQQACENCFGVMKPGVVFFGESAPKYVDLMNAFDPYDCYTYDPIAVNRIVIGTSLEVVGPDMLQPDGLGSSVLIDPNGSGKHGFTDVIKMKASEAIPQLREWISKR